MPSDGYWTLQVAATETGYSARTLRDWVAQSAGGIVTTYGEAPARGGSPPLLIQTETLLSWMETQGKEVRGKGGAPEQKKALSGEHEPFVSSEVLTLTHRLAQAQEKAKQLEARLEAQGAAHAAEVRRLDAQVAQLTEQLKVRQHEVAVERLAAKEQAQLEAATRMHAAQVRRDLEFVRAQLQSVQQAGLLQRVFGLQITAPPDINQPIPLLVAVEEVE